MSTDRTWKGPSAVGVSTSEMDVTDETFETDVLRRSHERPVVVDFWAEWCGPCRALGPIIESETAERAGTLELAKLDVDSNPLTANEYGIRSIPAVKAFRDGEVIDEFVGVRSPQGVAAFLDGLLGPSAADRLLDELRESGAQPEVLAALESRDHRRALELLLEQVESGDPEQRELVRELMVKLFGALGQEHPLSEQYRRQLAAVLY